MAKKIKVDKMFQNRTMKDLKTLEEWITARLNDFIQCENEAQVITYKKLKAQVDQAISEVNLIDVKEA